MEKLSLKTKKIIQKNHKAITLFVMVSVLAVMGMFLFTNVGYAESGGAAQIGQKISNWKDDLVFLARKILEGACAISIIGLLIFVAVSHNEQAIGKAKRWLIILIIVAAASAVWELFIQIFK